MGCVALQSGWMREAGRSGIVTHMPKARDKADARFGGQPFENGRYTTACRCVPSWAMGRSPARRAVDGPHCGVAAHLFGITKRRFAAPCTAAQIVRSHPRFIMR